MSDIRQKYEALLTDLKMLGSVVVAFSAGVDSAFLLDSAILALGTENVLAVTVSAPSVPAKEVEEAADFCKERGIRHMILSFDQFTIPGFENNPPDRCYLCKKALFSGILAESKSYAAVLEGSNADDQKAYRPGMRAIHELGVKSPLLEAGLTKAEIRTLSAERNLPTASKPSLSCLATRFPYGETLTKEKLLAVGQGEALLFSLGFSQARVRVHGDVARIEVPAAELDCFADPAVRSSVTKTLRSLGFRYVTLDLVGFRSGSMDEGLPDRR